MLPGVAHDQNTRCTVRIHRDGRPREPRKRREERTASELANVVWHPLSFCFFSCSCSSSCVLIKARGDQREKRPPRRTKCKLGCKRGVAPAFSSLFESRN